MSTNVGECLECRRTSVNLCQRLRFQEHSCFIFFEQTILVLLVLPLNQVSSIQSLKVLKKQFKLICGYQLLVNLTYFVFFFFAFIFKYLNFLMGATTINIVTVIVCQFFFFIFVIRSFLVTCKVIFLTIINCSLYLIRLSPSRHNIEAKCNLLSTIILKKQPDLK